MKKIKEAAKEYAISLHADDRHLSISEIEMYAKTDFEAGVEFAQRWIPVEEELPEIGEKVQVKLLIEIIGHKTTDIDHDRLILKDGKTWMFDVEQMAGIAVTHWRPIELK